MDLDESVYVGAPFAGAYTLDPTGASDYFPSDPSVGFYRFAPPARMFARIGTYDFITHDLGILIWNDTLSGDAYGPISNSPFQAAGYQWSSMAVALVDDFGIALDSDALPTGVPDLADFPTFTDFGIYLPGDDLGIGGTLTSLTPEPCSLATLALGAAMLLARRRRC